MRRLGAAKVADMPNLARFSLCLVLTFTSCRNTPQADVNQPGALETGEVVEPGVSGTSPLASTPTKQAEVPNLGPTPASVAATVHGEPITVDQVDRLSSIRSITREEALMTWIQATVVAQEARRNGFPALPNASSLEVATAYLGTLFSEETLCETISQRELKGLYEAAYKPTWPADIYQGDVVELRCCPEIGVACDTPQHVACFASLERHLQALRTLRDEWVLHSDWPPQRLLPADSPYRATDYTFLDWPGIPDDKQVRKRLLDTPTRKAIKTLKPGEVSAPLRSSLGVHLFRLNKVRKAITHTSPDFQLEGRQYLCKKRIQSTKKDYVKRLVQFVQVTPGVMELPRTEPLAAP